jgi:hypothetical protein
MAITQQTLEHAGALHVHRAPLPQRKMSARAPNPYATSDCPSTCLDLAVVWFIQGAP